jgi:hypothetical protein
MHVNRRPRSGHFFLGACARRSFYWTSLVKPPSPSRMTQIAPKAMCKTLYNLQSAICASAQFIAFSRVLLQTFLGLMTVFLIISSN